MAAESVRSRAQRGQATPSIVVIVSALVALGSLLALFVGGVGGVAGGPGSPAGTTRQVASTPSPQPTAEPSPETVGAKSEPGNDEQAKDERATDERAKSRERARAEGQAAKPKPRQRSHHDGPQEPTVPDVYVEVYNNSSITGLAASTAAQLQDGGWQVVGVDNWYGDIPASTVYYPDGLAAEAHQLARTLGIGRVWGAVSPMKFDRLTVILTPDAA